MRRALALAGTAALLLAAGCEVDVTAVVESDSVVRLDATWWYTGAELTSEHGGTVDPCLYVGSPSLVEEPLADPDDPNRRGCRLTGTTNLEHEQALAQQVINHVGGRYYLLPPTLPRGRWTAADPGTFRIAVTFPGEVVAAEGGARIDGRTVVWTDPAAAAAGAGLSAVAREPGALPGRVWTPLAGLAGLLVGAGATALALALRGRRRPDAAGAGSRAEPAASPAVPERTPPAAAPEPAEDPSVWAPDP